MNRTPLAAPLLDTASTPAPKTTARPARVPKPTKAEKKAAKRKRQDQRYLVPLMLAVTRQNIRQILENAEQHTWQLHDQGMLSLLLSPEVVLTIGSNEDRAPNTACIQTHRYGYEHMVLSGEAIDTTYVAHLGGLGHARQEATVDEAGYSPVGFKVFCGLDEVRTVTLRIGESVIHTPDEPCCFTLAHGAVVVSRRDVESDRQTAYFYSRKEARENLPRVATASSEDVARIVGQALELWRISSGEAA
ncbi:MULTISPECIES: hypothetical protein [Pseudomonas]|uniref:Uncharacterized protein n=1 Tax=Pseudomonas lutea TaxID=243924 RepID=A0A9X8QLQ4_9PSED|nr:MULTISPECIES: hypothetical protein [Pseudomonas]SER36558.1 hypothetical protein SAMN05216409_11857 [Pseudomonas lutea]